MTKGNDKKEQEKKKSSRSPRRGIEPRSPAWQAGILTTILPRNCAKRLRRNTRRDVTTEYLGEQCEGEGEGKKREEKRYEENTREEKKRQKKEEHKREGKEQRKKTKLNELRQKSSVHHDKFKDKTVLHQNDKMRINHGRLPTIKTSRRKGKNNTFSPAGNRTPVSRVTGGDTHHYTTEELCEQLRRNPRGHTTTECLGEHCEGEGEGKKREEKKREEKTEEKRIKGKKGTQTEERKPREKKKRKNSTSFVAKKLSLSRQIQG